MARGPLKRKIKKAKKGQLRIKGISGIEIRPTEQEIKIAEGLARGLTKKAALLAAGVSEKNARSNSKELTDQPGVRKAFDLALDRVGVGVERIAKVVDEGLKATQIISTTPIKIFPDFSERRQMARLACEIKNLIPDKKLAVEHSGSIGISDEADKELVNWLQSATEKK